MQEQNRFALKEWAIIQKALSDGRQTLLLRKGGLIESKGGFVVEHPEFFIYPTYLHQQRKGMVPEMDDELDLLLCSPPPSDKVILSYYAVVQEVFKVTELAVLLSLKDYHRYHPEEISRRFFYKGRPGLHLILLRLYRLPRPIAVPVKPHFEGCRSWVDLEREFPTDGCRAVLEDAAFASEANRIRKILRVQKSTDRLA